MKELTREAFLGSVEREVRAVEVSGFGAGLYVRALSLEEFEEAWGKGNTATERKSRLAFASACHADGSALFEPADYERFAAKRGWPLIQLISAAMKVNGMIDDDDAADDETVEGNV